MYPDYQLRLFRKTAGRYDDVRLHENLTLTGRRERLREPFIHYSMPTVNHHIRKMMRYTTLGADEKLKRVRHISGWTIATHHLGTILKTLFTRGGYRDGVHGLVVIADDYITSERGRKIVRLLSIIMMVSMSLIGLYLLWQDLLLPNG